MSGPATPYAWDLPSGLPSVIANWDVIENAIQAQLVTGSGLSADRVIWMHQSADRPDSDFLAVEHLDSSFTAPATPEIRQADTPDAVIEDPGVPGIGGELTLSAVDNLDFTIRLHYFAKASTGPLTARARLAAVRGYLGSENATAELDTDAIALVECGSVKALPAVLETKYESRAMLDVQFRTVDGFQELATFIQTANVGVRIPKSDGTDATPATTNVQIVAT